MSEITKNISDRPLFERELYISHNRLIIITIPILVFIAGDKIVETLGLQGVQQILPYTFSDTHLNVSGWYYYIASSFLFGGSAIAIAYIFISDVIQSFQKKSAQRIFVYAGVVCATNLLVILVTPYLGSPKGYEFLGKKLFELSLCKMVELGECKKSILGEFIIVNIILNVLSSFAVTSVIVGAITALAEVRIGVEDRKILALPLQIARLRRYLVLAAIHLVLGIFVMKAWHNFPNNVVPERDKLKYIELSESITQVNGVFFSLIIFSYYIPISSIMARRIRLEERRYIEKNAQNGKDFTWSEFEKWKKDNGLVLHNWEMYKAIISALAPLIAASLGTIAKFLNFN